MQGFIHVYKRKSNFNMFTNVEQLLSKYKSKSLFVHQVIKKNITSVYFSNEYEQYPYGNTESGMFTPVGVFTRNIDEIKIH